MFKNKILIAYAIFIAILFIGINSYASTGVVNVETVKMRKEASTESNIITLVSIDDKVEIIQKDGDWYKVKFNGKTGYIYAQYITTEDEETEETSTQEQTSTQNNTDNTSEENEQSTNNSDAENTINLNENIISESSQIMLVEDTDLKIVPLINSVNIETIKANTVVKILEYVNGWYCVSTQEIEGWVRKEKLDSVKTVETSATNTEKVENDNSNKQTDNTEEKEIKKYVNTEKVNVRKEANTNSSIIEQLTKNTEVTVISTNNEWSKVKINGKEGYISSEYLSDKKVEESEKNTTNRSLEISRKEDLKSEEVAKNEVSNSVASGESVVTYAKTFLGTKYVYGGATPKGFDCSGFTAYIFKKYGINLAHSASAQANVGTKVEKANLQLGDLVIFNGESNKSIGHVGIYVGGNQFIHASNPKGGVKITSLSTSYYLTRYVTARRVL